MSLQEWCIVLGSGTEEPHREGVRGGDASVPGPFRSSEGRLSPFGRSLRRARRLATADRIAPVFEERHRPWWEPEVRGLGAGNVLVQPRDRGTSPGLLLALLHVFDRDPLAIVTVLPCEHSVQDERGLRQAIRNAVLRASRLPGAVTLLGRPPRLRHPEPLWIVPCFADDDCSRILQLVESPTEERARELHGSGGLTPPLLMVGMARSFLDLFDAAAPSLLRAFLRAARSGPFMQDGRPGRPLQELHEHLEASDFSRDVLPRTEIRDLLRVARVPSRGSRGEGSHEERKAGWSWGRKRDPDLLSCE